jgi:hypothetical protein
LDWQLLHEGAIARRQIAVGRGTWRAKHAPCLFAEPFLRHAESHTVLGADPAGIQRVGLLDRFLLDGAFSSFFKSKKSLRFGCSTTGLGRLGLEL